MWFAFAGCEEVRVEARNEGRSGIVKEGVGDVWGESSQSWFDKITINGGVYNNDQECVDITVEEL